MVRDWVGVVGAFDYEFPLRAVKRVDDQVLVFRRYHGVFFRTNEQARSLALCGIGDRVELVWDLVGDELGKTKTPISIARPSRDHLGQRRRVSQEQSSGTMAPCEIECRNTA